MPHIIIASPSKTIFEGNAKSITLPTIDGVITVLNDHAPLIGGLAGGEVEIETDNENLFLAIDAGMIEISNNKVNIFTSDSVLSKEISQKMMEEAKKRAEELEISLDHANEEEYAKIAAELQKELAKINLGSR